MLTGVCLRQPTPPAGRPLLALSVLRPLALPASPL